MWLQLPLLEQRELLSQEEALGCQRTARPRNEYEEMGEIARNGRQRREAVCQRSEDGAGHKRLALHVTRRYVTWHWRLNGIYADHNLGLTKEALKAKVHLGRIPTVDLDKKLRFDRLDLDRMIEQNKRVA